MAINIYGIGFDVRLHISAFICLDFCTCAVTDPSFKGQVSFKAALYDFYFFFNDLFNDTPNFLPQVQLWKIIRVLTLDESSIIVEEIFQNVSECVKLLRIYKIFRQTTQATDAEILYFSVPPECLLPVMLLLQKERERKEHTLSHTWSF